MAIKDSVFNLVLKAKNLLSGETEKAADGLDQLSDSVKQYGDNVSNLKQAVKLEQQIAGLQQQSDEAADAVSAMSEAYAKSQDKVKAAGAVVASLESDYQKGQAGLSAFSDEVGRYKKRLEDVKSAQKLAKQIESLSARSEKAAATVGRLDKKYQRSIEGFEQASAALKALGDDVDQSSEQYKKAAAAQEKWADKVQSSADRLSAAQQKQERYQHGVTEAGEKLQLLKKSAEITADSVEQLDDEIARSTQTLKNAKATLTQQSQALKSQKADLSAARSELKSGTRELDKNTRALSRAEQKQVKFSSELDESKKRLVGFKQAAGLAADGADDLSGALKSAQTKLDQTKNDLKAAKAEAKGAGRAMSQAGAEAESAGSRFTRFGTGLVSTLGKASALVVGIGTGIAGWQITQKFKAAVQSGISFEQQMLNVAAAGQATEAELARLTAAAEKMGANTKYSATEAGAALETLVRAGYDTAEAIALLPAVLQTATAAKSDLATAAGLVSDQLSIFNRDASRATETTDVLSKGASLANTSILQIAEAMKTAGGQAMAYGYDLETTTAYIDILAKRAIRGGEAGTALRNILGQLGDPSSKAREELEKLGITSNNLTDVIAGLEQAGAGGEAAIQAFGLEAGPALRALISGGAAEVERLTTALRDSSGSTEEAAKRMGDSTQGAIKSLLSSLDAAGRKLAQPMLGVISSEAKLLAQDLRALAAGNDLDQLGSKIAEITQKITSSFRGWFNDIDYSTVTAALDAVSRGVDNVIAGLKGGAAFVKEWSSELILLGQALVGLKLAQMASGLASMVTGFLGLGRSAAEAGASAGRAGGRFKWLLSMIRLIPASIPITIAMIGGEALGWALAKVKELMTFGESGSVVAERSQARMKATAMEYAKTAQAMMEANARFADFEQLSSERIAELTEQELASYKARLAGAERYYRAKALQNKALEQLGLQDQFDTDTAGTADALKAIADANKAITQTQSGASHAVQSMGYIAEDTKGRILGMGASFDELLQRFPHAQVKAIQAGVGFGALAKDAKGAAGALDQQAKAAKDATVANAALVKSTGGDRQSRQSQIETKIAFKAQIDKSKTLDDFRLLEQQLSDALGEQTLSLSAYQELNPKIQQQLAALRQEASGLKKDLADGLGSAKVDVEIEKPDVEPVTVPVQADTAAVSQKLQAMSADYSAYMIAAENTVHANRMAKLQEYQATLNRLSAAGADELAREALKKGRRL